jgi:hypothetical protein
MMDCSVSKKEDSLLKDAARVHNEAVVTAKLLEVKLEQLSLDSTYLKDSIDVWITDLENWKSNLVEVPGNESHELHEHAHHNHGKQLPDLTAEQILLVQLEMQTQLESIKSRINSNKE